MAYQEIIDKLMSFDGVVTSVYGKYADGVVYDQDKERAKNQLFNLYGYKDIFDVLPPELDDQKTIDHVRTLMQMDIYQTPENTSQQAKKEVTI